MSAFTDFSGVQIFPGNEYRLTADLLFEIGREGSGLIYRVPAGFVFDVSIPRAAWWLFSPYDVRYLRAAALHDHMLADRWDRQTAAAVFYRALRASYVSPARAIIMYLAVSFHSLLVVDPATRAAGARPRK